VALNAEALAPNVGCVLEGCGRVTLGGLVGDRAIGAGRFKQERFALRRDLPIRNGRQSLDVERDYGESCGVEDTQTFSLLPLVLRFGRFWLLPRSNSLFLEKNSLIRVCKFPALSRLLQAQPEERKYGQRVLCRMLPPTVAMLRIWPEAPIEQGHATVMHDRDGAIVDANGCADGPGRRATGR
jgi:hypothetical protein